MNDRPAVARIAKKLLAAAGIRCRTRTPGRGLAPSTPPDVMVAEADLDRAGLLLAGLDVHLTLDVDLLLGR